MPIVLAIVLGLLALAFVLYPLRQRVQLGSSPAGDSAAAERELGARAALQEVELDYQLSNITEPEYRTLRERYMQSALQALKSRYGREQEIDEEIEAQLHALKENHEHTDN